MFEIIADLKTVESRKAIKIELEAPDLEELLVSWLRELLYRWSTEEILFGEFTINFFSTQGKKKRLSAEVRGEKLDPARHQLKTEVKAVTYHELMIQRGAGGWMAQLIFDV